MQLSFLYKVTINDEISPALLHISVTSLINGRNMSLSPYMALCPSWFPRSYVQTTAIPSIDSFSLNTYIKHACMDQTWSSIISHNGINLVRAFTFYHRYRTQETWGCLLMQCTMISIGMMTMLSAVSGHGGRITHSRNCKLPEQAHHLFHSNQSIINQRQRTLK